MLTETEMELLLDLMLMDPKKEEMENDRSEGSPEPDA